MRVFKIAMFTALFAGSTHGHSFDLPKMALTALIRTLSETAASDSSPKRNRATSRASVQSPSPDTAT